MDEDIIKKLNEERHKIWSEALNLGESAIKESEKILNKKDNNND